MSDLSLRTRIEIYLRDRGDGTYRQQLRDWTAEPLLDADGKELIPALKPGRRSEQHERAYWRGKFRLLAGRKAG